MVYEPYSRGYVETFDDNQTMGPSVRICRRPGKLPSGEVDRNRHRLPAFCFFFAHSDALCGKKKKENQSKTLGRNDYILHASLCIHIRLGSMAQIPSSASSSKDQEALRAATFQRLHPKVYLERFLAEGVRPDGRESDEWRQVSVNVGSCSYSSVQRDQIFDCFNCYVIGSISTADGSALVRLGNTTVVCGVKAEVAEPELDRPMDGFLGVPYNFYPKGDHSG